MARNSSNLRELAAVVKALVAFEGRIKGKGVQVLSDNITTVAYLTRQGSTKLEKLMGVAGELLSWAESKHLFLTVVHLKELLNQLADSLSHKEIAQSEWCPSRKIFA